MKKVEIQDLKRLRSLTGAGVGLCKEALLASEGDFESAQTYLKEAALKRWIKKSNRPLPHAFWGTAQDEAGQNFALVSLRCETDFVSRSELFRSAADQMAKALLEMGLSQGFDASCAELKPLLLDLVLRTDEFILIEELLTVQMPLGYLQTFHEGSAVALFSLNQPPLHPCLWPAQTLSQALLGEKLRGCTLRSSQAMQWQHGHKTQEGEMVSLPWVEPCQSLEAQPKSEPLLHFQSHGVGFMQLHALPVKASDQQAVFSEEVEKLVEQYRDNRSKPITDLNG